MLLLHIDDDPPCRMSDLERMMYGLEALRARCGCEELSLFAPDNLWLVGIESNRYHPLSLVFGVESYEEACELFGIDPHGIEARAYGFRAQMPERGSGLELIDGIWRPRTRALEILQLNALWQAEFRETWSTHSLLRLAK